MFDVLILYSIFDIVWWEFYIFIVYDMYGYVFRLFVPEFKHSMVLGKFLLRKFHLGKFHRENSSHGKFLLRCIGATLFRSWLASLAVGLRTLASQVRAQRHSRIVCYIVFRHGKILRKIKFASFYCSYVVSELLDYRLCVWNRILVSVIISKINIYKSLLFFS